MSPVMRSKVVNIKLLTIIPNTVPLLKQEWEVSAWFSEEKLMLVCCSYPSHRYMYWRTVVWDCRPDDKNLPINWVELKTSEEIGTYQQQVTFERKLLKFWAQSFLLGVPIIIVGFRSRDGQLLRLQEFKTQDIPKLVKHVGQNRWDGNLCINFAAAFLKCEYSMSNLAFSVFWNLSSAWSTPLVISGTTSGSTP